MMPMTYPRSHIVAEGEPGYFHVVTRCVRRAFLCGWDKQTGQSYEHRRQWIEARILELAECFAVSVYAYAVMSNHFHIVLHVDPQAAQGLSDEEVARCWLTAFPGRLKDDDSAETAERLSLAITGNPERLAELRNRLGSLSWFMKALTNEINDQQTFSLSLSVCGKASARRCSRVYIKRREHSPRTLRGKPFGRFRADHRLRSAHLK